MMKIIEQLQKSILAYHELLQVSDLVLDTTLSEHRSETDMSALLHQKLHDVQKIDKLLPEDLSRFYEDPTCAPLLHERSQLMEQILEKCTVNEKKLSARKSIVANELAKIRKSRTSMSAYKTVGESSGQIIRNRC